MTQPFFSDVEAKNFQAALREERNNARENGIDVPEYFNVDLPLVTVAGRMPTSIIFDPANGHIPFVARDQERGSDPDRLNGPEDLWLRERCIRSDQGPPMFPIYGEQFVQILQTDEHVVFLQEANHEARIVSLGPAHSHLSARVELWLGDGRGRWEGDALVVDTTNFRSQLQHENPQNRFDQHLHTIERFTLLTEDTLWYRFTVIDPTRFRTPFSGEFPLHKTSKRIFEDACHEGNYSLPNVLNGNRAQP